MKPTIDELLQRYQAFFELINNGRADRSYPGHERLIEDYKTITSIVESNSFFQKYGVGNPVTKTSLPTERGTAYEFLLSILTQIDSDHFFRIHKAIPYYFIAWTAYQSHNYRKAMFYLDAAFNEEKELPVEGEEDFRPSIRLLLLLGAPDGVPDHLWLPNIMSETLADYEETGGPTFTMDEFRKKFAIKVLFSGPQGRALLTALYTFLLEFDERIKEISWRSDLGGSIQPFLDHLLDGGRLLESLMEVKGGTGSGLGAKINSLPLLQVSKRVLLSKQQFKDAEIAYNKEKAAGSSFQDCQFTAAYIIRNTTAHSLLWPNQFDSKESYMLLYQCLVNSILWTIQKLWCD